MLGPITVKPVNQQDIVIFPESLTKLVNLELKLSKSYKTSQIKAKDALVCVTGFPYLVFDGNGNRILHKAIITLLNSHQR